MKDGRNITPVTMTPDEDGEIIREYDNSDYGWILLKQETTMFDGMWLRTQKRSCLLKGVSAELEKLLKMYPKLTLPGRLRVREFAECDLSEEDLKRYIGKDYDDDDVYNEYIDQYVKRAGNDGDELTCMRDGQPERIIRFVDYDFSGEKEDIFVQHDNHEAVSASRERQEAAKAKAEAAAKKLELVPVGAASAESSASEVKQESGPVSETEDPQEAARIAMQAGGAPDINEVIGTPATANLGE